MSNTNKMDTSAVFEMFETISNKLDKQPNKQTEVAQVELSAVNTLTERLEDVIKEVQKPTEVEHRHFHTIDISSSKVFLSMVVLILIILGLFYTIGEQRKTISKYQDNDLKYRYIKMQGQADEEKICRLERQFKYSDSIKIIRKQVEKYEELLREQAEKMERAKLNTQEAEMLRDEAESLKKNK